jgi:hypothetical protein
METNILSHSTDHTPSHKNMHRVFFLFFVEKNHFTDTIAILGGIQRFYEFK